MTRSATPNADHTAVVGVELRAHRGGHLVAWAGFGFGSLVSVAANVLAERIVPARAPRTWTPSVLAECAAAVWPIALLLSVELLARVKWKHGWQWLLARFGGAGVVAVGSAFISYSHIAAVLTSWGYTALGAHIGPLVIDGLMTISGFALLAAAAPTALPHSVPIPAPRPAPTVDAPEVSATATKTVVTPSPSGASAPTEQATPKVTSNVVSMTDGVATRDKMLAYLDENPTASGADLDREFGTKDYGRTVLRQWRNAQAKKASGE